MKRGELLKAIAKIVTIIVRDELSEMEDRLKRHIDNVLSESRNYINDERIDEYDNIQYSDDVIEYDHLNIDFSGGGSLLEQLAMFVNDSPTRTTTVEVKGHVKSQQDTEIDPSIHDNLRRRYEEMIGGGINVNSQVDLPVISPEDVKIETPEAQKVLNILNDVEGLRKRAKLADQYAEQKKNMGGE